MKICKNFLIILLSLGFLNLTGMSEEKRSKIGQQAPLLQPLTLKTKCALNILNLIKSEKMSWEMLSTFPEGLARYIELFHIADVYMNDSISVIEDEEDQSPELSKLIIETKALLHGLIDSDFEYLETLILALDEFFDSYMVDKLRIYKITERIDIENVFKLMNIVLKVILDPKKACVSIGNHNEVNLKKKEELSQEQADILFQNFAKNAVRWNFVYIFKLMLDLDLLPRDIMLVLFEVACNSHCSAQILRLLNDKIHLTKNEFESMLKQDSDIFISSINGHLDIVEYIIELIQEFGLDISKIINRKYEYGETLLIAASLMGYLDIVALLLAKGADFTITDDEGNDALFYAERNYSNFDRNGIFDHGSEEGNKEYIAEQLSEMKAIIKALGGNPDKNERGIIH